MTIPKCPADIGAAGKRFWRAIHSSYVIDDVDRREKLAIACRSLDDEASAAEAIERDGRYIQGRFGCKEHPAGKVLRDSRIVFLRALRELGLDVEGVVESRPAPLYGGKNAAKKR
jgi:hypothetical protein